MTENESDGMSRRGLLRKTAAAGAGGLAGVTLLSTEASAEHIYPGTRIVCTDDWSGTFNDCCVRFCGEAYRFEGEKGKLLEYCDYNPNGYTLAHVWWDDPNSNGNIYSYIPEEDIDRA